MKYKIKMLEAAGVKEGWFDGRPYSCNQVIYARTVDESKAQLFDYNQAVHFVLYRARGWPCQCVPPINLTL